MGEWIADFDSWDVCDQVISNLFDQTPYAYKKAFEWSGRKAEFEKRAGFVMMQHCQCMIKPHPTQNF